MNTKTVVILYLATLSFASENSPKVYEDYDQTPSESRDSLRVIRTPNSKQRGEKLYKTPVYDYKSSQQQDQIKKRYLQQQLVDFRNFLARKTVENRTTRGQVGQNWKVIDPKFTKSGKDSELVEKPKNSWTRMSLNYAINKSRTNRKLNPSTYFKDLQTAASETDEKVDRQDHAQITYMPSHVLKQQYGIDVDYLQSLSDQDLSALNALVGQDPNQQLEGLKKLLELQQFVQPQPFQPRDHTPIVEEVMDIPNKQSKPNINVDLEQTNTQTPIKHSLETLQAQLDAVAQAQAQQVIAQAQKEAMAHVEAQHQAIAQAKINAQKQAYAHFSARQPMVVLQPSTGFGNSLAETLKKEIVTIQPEVYASNHQSALEEGKRQNEVKKVRITKTHSVTKGHQMPNAYQEVKLETQHQKDIYPIKVKDIPKNEHQYASRYAFGYKIKDFHMGNDFGHEEKRDGKSAKGHYHVLLPDGRLQNVEYYADMSGYHAKVTYENAAYH